MSSPWHRLFFALWPEDGLRRRLAARAARIERQHAPGGRRVAPDRYHLTLQFLGDFQPVPPGLLDAACAAAGSVRLPAFDLMLDCVGSFPGSRVWWLGTQAVATGLRDLWDRLGDALVANDVPTKPVAAFAPHLTIQRNVRRQTEPVAVEPLPWPVRDFVLVDSVQGSDYRMLGRWPLMRA